MSKSVTLVNELFGLLRTFNHFFCFKWHFELAKYLFFARKWVHVFLNACLKKSIWDFAFSSFPFVFSFFLFLDQKEAALFVLHVPGGIVLLPP